MVRSALGGFTVVVVVAELFAAFESLVDDATLAVLLMLVTAGFVLTLTTILKVALSLGATEALEKTTLAASPEGIVVVQPAPLVNVAETKVVLAGTASVTVTFCAANAPAGLFTSNV